MTDPNSTNAAPQKKQDPIAAVISTVRKFLVTNQEFSEFLSRAKEDEVLAAFIASQSFEDLTKLQRDLDNNIDELLDTMSALFVEYTALLGKSAQERQPTE